jgi:flagellar protein FliS
MEKMVMSMDFANSGIRKYQNNSVFNRPPELLTLDLYDGAIRFINEALEGFELEAYEKININLSKSGAIIDELTASLNFEKGGDMAKSFANLYGFIRTQLTIGLVKKDKKAVEDALKIVQIMRDTWSEGVVKERV